LRPIAFEIDLIGCYRSVIAVYESYGEDGFCLGLDSEFNLGISWETIDRGNGIYGNAGFL